MIYSFRTREWGGERGPPKDQPCWPSTAYPLFVCVFYHGNSQFYKQHAYSQVRKRLVACLNHDSYIWKMYCHWFDTDIVKSQRHVDSFYDGEMSAYKGFEKAMTTLYIHYEDNWLGCQITLQQIKKRICLLPYFSYHNHGLGHTTGDEKKTPLNQPTANFWQELLRNLP